MFTEFTIYDDKTYELTDGQEDQTTQDYVNSVLSELTILQDDVCLVKRIDDTFYVYSWEGDDIKSLWSESVTDC